MKLKTFLIAVVAISLATITPTLYATPTLIAGTLATVNTNLFSTTNAVLNYSPASQTITVTHGALTSTNAGWVSFQPTLDGVNFINATNPTTGNSIWYPSFTNACTETIPPGYFSFNPGFRLVTGSTNSIQVSESYGQ
jgi:hypothetical protein